MGGQLGQARFGGAGAGIGKAGIDECRDTMAASFAKLVEDAAEQIGFWCEGVFREVYGIVEGDGEVGVDDGVGIHGRD